MNKRIIFLIILITVIIAGVACWYYSRPSRAPTNEVPIIENKENVVLPTPTAPNESKNNNSSDNGLNFTSCAGGTVVTSMCCKSAGDFPNTCLIGACGCSPANSHEVKICDCGPGKCFNGKGCVSQ